MRGKWQAPLGLVLLTLIWAAASYFRSGDSAILPSPAAVTHVLYERAADGSILRSVAVSGRRLLTGYFMALVVGFALGGLMTASDNFRKAFQPLILGLQALPSICWLPLGLLWFGLSDAAILFVITLGSSLSIALAIDGATRNIPPLYLKAARTMGASGITLVWRVILPAALPDMVTGMRLAWAFAWRSLMAGELLFVTGGLGYLLQVGRELGDMAQVVAVMLLIVALGLTSEQLVFAQMQKYLARKWGRAPA